MPTIEHHELRHRVHPELVASLENYRSVDIWTDIPAGRIKLAELAANMPVLFPVLDEVPYSDRFVPGPEGDPDVRVRIYRPNSAPETPPVLLWIHGGGYILGNVEGDVGYVQQLALNVGCVVVSVDYRLAPEHPFPAPVEDCYAALKWLSAHTNELGVDPQRIAIGGISAGGGLAAGLALLARDRGEIDIMFQLLMCPMIDDRNHHPSTHLPLSNMGWDRECNRNGWAAYLNRPRDADPGAAPVSCYAAAARAEDLGNLPPAYIPVGTLDLFVDENIDYAQRLMHAGVATELHVFPGGFHAFECRVPSARVSRRANNLVHEILHHAFEASTT